MRTDIKIYPAAPDALFHGGDRVRITGDMDAGARGSVAGYTESGFVAIEVEGRPDPILVVECYVEKI